LASFLTKESIMEKEIAKLTTVSFTFEELKTILIDYLDTNTDIEAPMGEEIDIDWDGDTFFLMWSKKVEDEDDSDSF
jgi:hypothetical protein